MNKITIIGANSSIARNFIYFLRDKNILLTLYDIQDTFSDAGEFNYHKIDLNSIESINSIDCTGDAIYVFSGLTGAERSIDHTNLFIDINEKALVNIVELVRKTNLNCHIIYPSSRLVYDDFDGPLKEDYPLKAKSVYAANKIFAESFLKINHDLYGINYTVFRIAIPFGQLNPNAFNYGIVSKLVSQGKNGCISLYGDGGSIRTFTHIKNICEIFYQAAEKNIVNDVYNIGGCHYSFLELAKMIQKKENCLIAFEKWPLAAKNVEVKNGYLDSTKLDKKLPIKYIDLADEID